MPRSIPASAGPPAYLVALPAWRVRPHLGEGPLDAYGGPQDIHAEPQLRLPGAGRAHWFSGALRIERR
eukprot:13889303-Alexandrium_andersonii.AAC.1